MEQAYAWLVVNGFVHTEKFNQIFEWLVKAAQKQGLLLEIRTNTQLLPMLAIESEPELPCAHRPMFAIFWDKDTRLARLLEKRGLRLFNCAESIEACDDKARTHIELSGCGIKMPRTVIGPKTFCEEGYPELDFFQAVADRLGFPMVIKECYGSFGQQVHLTQNMQEAKQILSGIKNRPCLFQEFVASSRGRDVRIQMVGTEAVAAMRRYNAHDYRANVTAGGSMEPYEPTPEQLAIARTAMERLKLDFAGIDLLFGEKDEPLLCEVNSNAHFVNICHCTGVNAADAIIRHCLDMACK